MKATLLESFGGFLHQETIILSALSYSKLLYLAMLFSDTNKRIFFWKFWTNGIIAISYTYFSDFR